MYIYKAHWNVLGPTHFFKSDQVFRNGFSAGARNEKHHRVCKWKMWDIYAYIENEKSMVSSAYENVNQLHFIDCNFPRKDNLWAPILILKRLFILQLNSIIDYQRKFEKKKKRKLNTSEMFIWLASRLDVFSPRPSGWQNTSY